MRTALTLIISVLLAVQATAQTPRELWNQVPRAAGDTVTSFCKTDTVKVNRYIKSLDATIARIDGLIKAKETAMRSKEGAAKAEMAEMLKNSPTGRISAAERARIANMSDAQKKDYADGQLKQATGMDVEGLKAMGKKMENASEEDQMAMAMQMLGGMDLSGMGMVEAEPVDEKKLRILELQNQLVSVGSEYMAQLQRFETSFPESQYVNEVIAARVAAFKKYARLDGMESEFDLPKIRALDYQNFLNFLCPAVSPISLKYMNRNIALLDIELKSSGQAEAIVRELASLEPTAVNKLAIEAEIVKGYGIVRKYAVELKRRYEAFSVLATFYWDSPEENRPKDSPMLNRDHRYDHMY